MRKEAKIQKAIISKLRSKEWFVKATHGNEFQAGFPDLFCANRKYGIRWVEVKLPDMKGSHFTPAQLVYFPQFAAAGVGIWILTSDSDYEINKLFGPPNWYMYLPSMRR